MTDIVYFTCILYFTEMSELLFECYHVPSVAYGIDSLFSLYNNHPSPSKLRCKALNVNSSFANETFHHKHISFFRNLKSWFRVRLYQASTLR